MRLDLLKAMNEERANRRAAILVTEIGGAEQRLVKGDAVAGDPLAEALDNALRSGKSGMVAHEGRDYFLTTQVPAVRLVIDRKSVV